MTRRPLAVELAGAALRELLPWLRKLADWMDPIDALVPPVEPEPLTVPTAWVEMEGQR
jgi:hypothetical protein